MATAPVNKAAFAAAGLPWKGHTDLLGAPVRRVARGHDVPRAELLKVVLATVHVALRDVPRAAHARRWSLRRCGLTARELPGFGVAAPRLAVAGLNPHAGEDGLMGTEDDEVLAPAVRDVRADGLDVTGPFRPTPCSCAPPAASSTAWWPATMIRDSIPVKLLAFGMRRQRHARPADHPHVGRSRHGVRHRRPGPRRPRQPGGGRRLAAELAAARRESAREHPRPRRQARRPPDAKDDDALIAENRKALHDYHILETFEAGVQLLGTEVKGIREGRANLRDSYARVEKGEVWLYNVHINPYSHRGYVDHEPRRRAQAAAAQAGDPQADRQDHGEGPHAGAAADVLQERPGEGGHRAWCRGKKLHDKRETIRKREVDRETRAAVKERSRR